MNAGRLNRRITIQSRPMGQDSYGQETGSWTNFATLWADVEPITGNEFFTAAAVGSEINRRIVTRYHAGITHRSAFYSVTKCWTSKRSCRTGEKRS